MVRCYVYILWEVLGEKVKFLQFTTKLALVKKMTASTVLFWELEFPFYFDQEEGLWPLDTSLYLFLSGTVCCDRGEVIKVSLRTELGPPSDFPSIAHVNPELEKFETQSLSSPLASGNENTLEEGNGNHIHKDLTPTVSQWDGDGISIISICPVVRLSLVTVSIMFLTACLIPFILRGFY